MSYIIPESFQPVLETEATDELKRKFRNLCREVFTLFYGVLGDFEDIESLEAAVGIMHQNVTEEIAAHPILARVAFKQVENRVTSTRCLRNSLLRLSGDDPIHH